VQPASHRPARRLCNIELAGWPCQVREAAFVEWAEPREDGDGAELLQQRRLLREAEYAEIKKSRHARAVADCKTAYDKKEEKKLVKQAAKIESDIISLLDSDNSKSRATPLKRTVSQVGCCVAPFGLTVIHLFVAVDSPNLLCLRQVVVKAETAKNLQTERRLELQIARRQRREAFEAKAAARRTAMVAGLSKIPLEERARRVEYWDDSGAGACASDDVSSESDYVRYRPRSKETVIESSPATIAYLTAVLGHPPTPLDGEWTPVHDNFREPGKCGTSTSEWILP